MANKKKQSDLSVLDKALRTVSKSGFQSFTLRQVSGPTGLSPSALIKRFKTKKNLGTLSRNRQWESSIDRVKQLTESGQISGVAGIFRFIDVIADNVETDRLGEHLAQLGADALSPKLRKQVGDYFRATRDVLQDLLLQAIEMGEIQRPVRVTELAMVLEAVIEGSIVQFAFLNERSIHAHLKANVETFLFPLRDRNCALRS